ncbi:SWI/SNF-related matrix-associated actin-dependent regulator of chromatin subfamily D member 1-like [Halichondria panicea]|uniref:SWI/SNF-related matrix-associated actin-dependent regulator of chromatin subfamily D member 1-like n=1 Tax=Halichondria panicea TaxID=6063 RepID=UPI00312B5F9B
MATRIPPSAGSSYMQAHGYQPAAARYMQGHPSVARHGTHSSRSSGHQGRSATELNKKRLAEAKLKAAHAQKMKKRRNGDRVLSQRIRNLVPESQAYMDLLTFEHKLDATITRKRLEIQEAIRRPMKQKRKLRVFISHQFVPGEAEVVPKWELKVEGRLLDKSGTVADELTKMKLTSFFKTVIIELDKEAYGPDNHVTEWHRGNPEEECDGFSISRPGEETVKCTILLLLNHQPVQYKLTSKLARLLGIHTAKRPDIINAVWQYIKSNKLQDPQEREYINNDKYFQQIFEVPRMKFTEIPRRVQPLLAPPDPIVIHHLINADAPEGRRTACYDIEVEIDDPLKGSMQSFLMSSTNQQEIAVLDNKIHDTVEQVNAIKLQREFYLGFADNPQKFINDWLASQSRDLKAMKNKMGNPEAERKASHFEKSWCQETVPRYFYSKVNQRKSELEQALGIRHP